LEQSIKRYQESFSKISIKDRFDLYSDGIAVLRANEFVKQAAAPESRASRKTWVESVTGEISSIEKYMAAAKSVNASLDATLKDLSDSDKIRLKENATN
jgi:hypothetical protein